MDEECVICKETMGLKTFDDASDEGLEDNCYRLSCKHAFHATCIIGSLRVSGSTCPICRDGAPPPPSQIFSFQFEESESETTNTENDRLIELQNRNPQVRAAATNLNRSVKSFNIFRDKLRSHRRKSLAIAMREFRNKYSRAFRLEKERVRQSLHTYRTAVHADSPIEIVDIKGLLEQDNTHAAVRRQDPMRTSFWYY